MVVTCTVEESIARIRLDRAADRNPLSADVLDALHEHTAALEADHRARVLVLTGDGSSFSAGADLKQGAYAEIGRDWADRRHAAGGWQRLLDRFDRLPQVTIAGLRGHVIGGGALLAAACDLRIGAEDTTVRIPELAIGLPLTWCGIPRLVREVGLPAARDWVMTGRAVGIDELERTGFVTRRCGVEDLDAAVEAAVREVMAMPAGPAGMTRAMFAALSRQHPAMVAGWADADLLQWSTREAEGRAAAVAYAERVWGDR